MPTWKRTTAKTMPTRRPHRPHEHLWIGDAAVINGYNRAGGEKEVDRFGVCEGQPPARGSTRLAWLLPRPVVVTSRRPGLYRKANFVKGLSRR